jgi:hypothetical protein
MENRFDSIPMEDDTVLMLRKQVSIGGFSCVHEVWRWDGVSGESVIFRSEDVEQLTDEEILDLIGALKKSPEESATVKRKSDFVFVNFNFET